jgi:hypothetical protein
LGGRGRRISEFEASLVYRVSSRTARATQRNPVSRKKKKKKTKKRMGWGGRKEEKRKLASTDQHCVYCKLADDQKEAQAF